MQVYKNGIDKKLPIKIHESVAQIIRNERYETYTVIIKAISTNGDNYLAELFEVDVKGSTVEGDKETRLFIKKIVPENCPLVSVEDCYLKELFVYNDLFKVYNKLQEDANIPKDQRFNMTKSYDESNPTAIILENMSRKGYKTLHREEILTLKFAELSVQQLARFHGLSFVLEKMQPKYFKENVLRHRTSFRTDDNFVQFLQRTLEITLKHLDGEAKKKMEAYADKLIEKYIQYITDHTSTVCCLCHKDYRQSNILMKESNGGISKVIPVDYQLIGYGVPIYDLLLLIFGGSDRNFRKNHFDYLKNLYMESLSKFLKFFNIDVETVYPRSEYERIMKERLDYGLMLSFQYFPFMFVSNDDYVDMSKENLMDWSFKPSNMFMERMTGIIDDFIQWGYL